MVFENDLYFSFIKIFLTTVCTLGMMCSLIKLKYDFRKTIFILAIYMGWVAISNTAILYFLGYMAVLHSFIFTISMPAVIIVYFLAKNSPTQAIFNYTTQIVLSIALGISVTLLNTALHGGRLSDIFIRIVLYASIILLEWRFLRRPFLRLTAVLKKGWGILSLIPVVFCLLLIIVGLFPNHFTQNAINVVYMYSVLLAMVVVYFALFQSLTTQYRLHILTHDGEIQRLQVSALESRMETAFAVEEAVRIEHHDLHHRLQAITTMIKKDDKNAALDFIGASQVYVNSLKPVHWCRIPVLDAIFASYFNQAETAAILVEPCLAISAELPVDAAELSIVLANALENAINACMELPEHERRIICKCISSPKFMLEISNPYTGNVEIDEDGLPIATKENHGIGTRSIAAFVQKHHAFCDYEAKDGWFHLRIML